MTNFSGLQEFVEADIASKIMIEYIHEQYSTRYSLDQISDILGRVKNEQDKKDLALYFKSTVENKKVGVLVAFKYNDKVLVGYSIWNPFKDEYNMTMMFEAAFGRAFKFQHKLELPYYKVNEFGEKAPYVPTRVADKLEYFIGRVKKYFKDTELVAWAANYY